MRRRRLISLLSLLVCLWSSLPVSAFMDLGHVCFQLAPFGDVLDLHVKQPDATEPFFALNAVWQGGDVYELLGGGTAYGSPVLGVPLVLNHETAFFDANRDCPFHGTINLVTLAGSWTMTCFGQNAPFILAGGTLVLTACVNPLDEVPPAAVIGQGLAGAPR